jgi:uncharacterized protein YkwD
MDHELDGQNAGDRLRAKGLIFNGWGENIAEGYSTPAAVMRAWMNSPGHRANILDCDFTSLGVGAVFKSNGNGGGAWWWTQDFFTV